MIMTINWIPDEFIHAGEFAAQAHLGQTIPGSDVPYLWHLMTVTMEVTAALQIEPHHDGSLAVQCALLHDVIEDTTVTYNDIAKQFGTRIADGVLALSKNPGLDKSDQMIDSLNRIKLQPPEIGLIKLADRISNLHRPLHIWSSDKIRSYPEESKLIHDELCYCSKYLAQRLLDKIEAFKLSAGIS